VRTLALLAFAALAFSILVGRIELLWTRHAQQRREERTSTVLHPFTRNRFRRVRTPLSRRAQYHVGLFFGFLVAVYVGIVVRIVYNFVIAHMF
jgi:hypothetical protein